MDELILAEERDYLDKTMQFLKKELDKESTILQGQRKTLTEANRTMWEETSHRAVTTETVPFLDYFLNTAHTAEMSDKQVKKYMHMLYAPYFGRFDFTEDGYDDNEKIYIGYYNLMDSKLSNVYVYDWRAPISSLYYRYELGDCSFQAPGGEIFGKMTLKRQYQIEKGELQFYFDSAITIRDDILIFALSQNASQKMKNIVETIQKEQDMIIRDLSHNVLVVQGVAGSGKTSVALHRAAYLLYETEQTKLTKDNILILSPNGVFSDYIDNVLPSLGEEKVETTVLDFIFRNEIKSIYIQPKSRMLDAVISETDETRRRSRMAQTSFLCGNEMHIILEKLAIYYERYCHKFYDVTINGEILFTKEELKALFLDNKANLSAESRLKRIEKKILQAAEEKYPVVSAKLNKIINENPKFRFEEVQKLEAAMSKYRARFESNLKKQTTINILDVFCLLNEPHVLKYTAKNMPLPKNANKVFSYTVKSIRNNFLSYEVAAPVLYLKLLLCGSKKYANMRHIIIDEAQDYYQLHYHIFGKLYPNAKFTILGDKNQAVTKTDDFYNEIGESLGNGSTAFVSLTKSYRSSKEISLFANSILENPEEAEAVERGGDKPVVHVMNNKREIFSQMANDILSYIEQGYKTIAVVTKTLAQSEEVSCGLTDEKLTIEKKVMGHKSGEHIGNGVNIIPVYMAKGLEFDAVLVYGADSGNYESEFDRKLLYVACTRALHKLSVFADKKLSRFIINP